MVNKIIQGDALEILRTMPDESVHCIVTSPPYWGLRDYGVTGQLGLEKTPEEYVAKMVELFREARRVLRSDGTLWLNLGDSYAGSWGAQGRQGDGAVAGRSACAERQIAAAAKKASHTGAIPEASGLKPKDLIGIPWRVAFALQADGWWLRSDIIWAKPNPMPESVTDRPTKAHEYIFLLTKSAKYYYDAEAIKERGEWSNEERYARIKDDHKSLPDEMKNGLRQRKTAGWKSGPGAHGNFHDEGRAPVVEYFENKSPMRNRRTVWTVATAPFSEAHFATFPPDLIRPCILAGCPEQCCPECGAPYMRVVERGLTAHDGKTESRYQNGTTANRLAQLRQAARERGEEYANGTRSLGFRPSCGCGRTDTVPGTVLDTFMGAGTTALVALESGRRFLGIELKQEYIDMSMRRIKHLLEQGRLF